MSVLKALLEERGANIKLLKESKKKRRKGRVELSLSMLPCLRVRVVRFVIEKRFCVLAFLGNGDAVAQLRL